MRHVIEHNTKTVSIETRIHPNDQGRFRLSFNHDENIDSLLQVKCIKAQTTFFQSQPKFDLVSRRIKAELQAALEADNFEDQIMYFCCHGEGGGHPNSLNLSDAKLKLTDQAEI